MCCFLESPGQGAGEVDKLFDLGTDLEEQHNLAAKHPDVANRLRAKLIAWGAELKPPGIALGPMAPAWKDYFDHYLEGKIATGPLNNRGETTKTNDVDTQGWLARNGTLSLKDGAFHIASEKQSQSMCITRNQLKLQGPLEFKNTQGNVVLMLKP